MPTTYNQAITVPITASITNGIIKNNLAREKQKLAPGDGSALIELFEAVFPITATGQPLKDSTSTGTVFRFHAGTNEYVAPVLWQGNEYTPLPIFASGFEITGQGTLPRPTLKIANISGLFSILTGLFVDGFNDLIGIKIVRRRTLAKYLDAANFIAGNPDADPSVEFPQDIYYIDRKTSETKMFVEFELTSALDLQGVMLPRRQFIANVCGFAYRGAECGYYLGAVADINDNPTSDPALDNCGKRLKSCRLRFGDNPTDGLPFGGFPSSVRNAS